MSSPMPGWYPDPEAPDRQRFWDGTQWTEARAYPANAVGAEGTQPAGQLPPQQTEEKSTPWAWIAVVAIVAIALLIAAYFLVFNKSSEPEPLPTITRPTVTSTATDTSTSTATVTAPTPTITETVKPTAPVSP